MSSHGVVEEGGKRGLQNKLLKWNPDISVVRDTVTLPFTLKSILRQKKNYENSNISPFKNINLQKNPLKVTKKPSRYYNCITNLKSQHKPQYDLSKVLIY